MHGVGCILLTLYVLYFMMIMYKALQTIKSLRKSYRMSVGMTIFTMSICAILMYFNGQASQRMDPPIYLSLLTLFNLYVQLIAYFYAPDFESGPGNSDQQYDIS
jgi:hypothetical protein